MNLDKATTNPYAPPQAGLIDTSGAGCYRDGKLVVVPAGQCLPERCVKCDAPATMDKPRTYSWHSPGYFLCLLIGPIVYIIVGLIVRKKVKLAIGLCDEHRQRRRTFNLIALGLLVLGVLCIFGAIQFSSNPLGGTATLLLLAALFVALFGNSILSPALIDSRQARFRGCGKAFLDSLPER